MDRGRPFADFYLHLRSQRCYWYEYSFAIVVVVAAAAAAVAVDVAVDSDVDADADAAAVDHDADVVEIPNALPDGYFDTDTRPLRLRNRNLFHTRMICFHLRSLHRR